jgi:hypothetical protein
VKLKSGKEQRPVRCIPDATEVAPKSLLVAPLYWGNDGTVQACISQTPTFLAGRSINKRISDFTKERETLFLRDVMQWCFHVGRLNSLRKASICRFYFPLPGYIDSPVPLMLPFPHSNYRNAGYPYDLYADGYPTNSLSQALSPSGKPARLPPSGYGSA